MLNSGDPSSASGEQDDNTYGDLIDQLEECQASALELSDSISRRYFSHATSGNQSFGA